MVKSYDRYEQNAVFGVISAQSKIVWLPPTSSKSIGSVLASGLESIIHWDIKTGQIINTFTDGNVPGALNASTSQAPSPVTRISVHQASGIFAAGYNDGSIKVWDLASALVMISFQGHRSAITQLEFDSSGTRLVSGSNDSSIIVWDLVAEEGLVKFKGHKGPITGMHLILDPEKDEDELEDYLVSVSKDGLVKLWDLKTKQAVETHLAHSSECWSLALNPANDMLVTCGNNDQVKVWQLDLEAEDGHKLTERGAFEKQSKSRCADIQFKKYRDSDIFLLQNTDRTCELFRVRGADEVKKGIARRTKRLTEKGYEKDEITQSLKDLEISMLITPFATVRTQAKVKSAVFAGNGFDLVVGLANNTIEYHRVEFENIKKNAEISKLHTVDLLGHKTDIRAMDLSDDNSLLATASNGELKVWNSKTKNVIRLFVLDSGYALCCKFLPGGSLVAVGFKNGSLELFDLATSSVCALVENAHGNDENGSIWSMDLTPDGKTLVTGSNDKSVKFWSLKPVQELVPGTLDSYVTKLQLVHSQTLELNEEVLCVKLSPDSKFLAVSLLNNNVQVVFFDTLKLFLTLYGHKLPVLSIDISTDSKLIITSSADKNIKIWGLDFGDCHKSIFGHQDSVMNVRFIPGTHNFFSSGKDGLIKYWDGDKFECIQKLAAHQGEVWCLAVSTDGTFMVSTSHDHLIREWSATNDQVFLEEEREKEMDELYENNLLDGLEEEKPQNEDEEDVDETEKVSKPTMETLKAGEKLMEALDIGIEDVLAVEEYVLLMEQYRQKKIAAPPSKPTPNSILIAFGVSGQEYVLNTLLKIRSAQLEDALLVLPFSYTLKLLKMIEIWTNKDNITGNIVNISLICKVLYFVVRSNAKELINQKDEKLKNQLIKVKQQLRGELVTASKQLGYNTQGLLFHRQQWKLHHETQYIDEAQQQQHDDSKAIKRTFTTV